MNTDKGLKPCPFCGSLDIDHTINSKFIRVQCCICDASIYRIRTTMSDNDAIKFGYKKWNTRTKEEDV